MNIPLSHIGIIYGIALLITIILDRIANYKVNKKYEKEKK